MMIESHYYLNVAKAEDHKTHYRYYCRIKIVEIIPEDAIKRARDISERFPSPEFKVTLTRVECVGSNVALD